jgi:sulfur relay (sulfurtransferase) complex TusBCD TusD component (DsrE family)
MNTLRCILAVLLLCGSSVTSPASAEDNDPLFVNLTTDGAFRTMMAMRFAQSQLERGHPLTVFLNDRGILLASKAHEAQYSDQQKLLAELLGKGTVVIACPQCLKQFNIPERDRNGR